MWGLSKSGCLLALGGLAVAGCAASTRLTGAGSDPNGTPVPLRRVMVIGTTNTGAARRRFEDQFAAALRSRGIAGEPSYPVVPDEALDTTKVDMEVHRKSCDGLFVTRVLRDTTVRTYYRAGRAHYQVPAPTHGDVYEYYANGHKYTGRVGYSEVHRVVDLETKLYRVSDGKLLWSARSHSQFAKSVTPDKQIGTIVQRLVRKLEKSGYALRSAT